MSDPIEPPQGLITHDNVWQFGILGVVCVGLVIAVIWLVRYNLKRDAQQAVERQAMEKERDGWELEREKTRLETAAAVAAAVSATVLRDEKLRGEYEARHREISVQYARELGEQVKGFRENDSAMRREFAATLEAVAETHAETIEGISERIAAQGDRQVLMIEKLTDRIVIAPKGGRYGGG